MIDQFDGIKYQRAITLDDGKVIEVSVVQTGSLIRKPLLKVEIRGTRINSEDVHSAKQNLERLLGLKIDLTNFYRLAKRNNPKISALVKRFRGMKPPRFPSVFETLLNAISCQQVSVTVGLLLLNRLVWNYGRTLVGGSSSRAPSSLLLRAFPSPADLSRLKPDNLRKLGFSMQKSSYIIGLSKSIIKGEIDLEEESLQNMSDEDALDYLQSIPGIGRWSSQYVLLRGLGRLHRFPADDVGAQNGLRRILGLRTKLNYDKTIRLIAPWQPYAGMIYFHLLLNRLEEKENSFSLNHE
jgi:DNA-3-methyladenine glycosylase II